MKEWKKNNERRLKRKIKSYKKKESQELKEWFSLFV